MATDEWYRSSAWEADERVAFEARLKRARDDNRPQYLMIRAAALLESGHEADAVSFLQRVLHEYPQDLFAASCAEQLGDHYLATGDPLAAERHYRQSLTLKPDQNATTGEVPRSADLQQICVPLRRRARGCCTWNGRGTDCSRRCHTGAGIA